MCLAVPARVVSVEDGATATVDFGGVLQEVALDLVPGTCIGDYVIVHVGFALERLDQAEAEKTLALLGEFLPR